MPRDADACHRLGCRNIPTVALSNQVSEVLRRDGLRDRKHRMRWGLGYPPPKLGRCQMPQVLVIAGKRWAALGRQGEFTFPSSAYYIQ
jgi:hypothetical protein